MRHFLSFLILSLLLSASCADDLKRHSIFATTSEQVVISFSVDNIVLTRSENQAFDESAIKNAYIIFYESDNIDYSGVPTAVVKAESPELGKLRFNLPAALETNKSYRLLAVANADEYKPNDFLDFEDYLESLFTTSSSTCISDICLSYSDCITSTAVTSLPMKGESADGSLFRFSKSSGVVYVNMSLVFRRLVSRIDITALADNFKMDGAALCNWRDAVSLDSSNDIVGNICGVLSSSENSDDDLSEISFLESVADDSGHSSLIEALYCFPSSVDNPKPGDTETTALIIKGKFADDTECSYYRVNLGVKDNRANLKPNTKYVVNITAVNGRGYQTSAEAYAATEESGIVTAIVEDWDIDEGNYVADDDGHVMIVSKSSLEYESDDVQAQEVKVLASKDLVLSASFISEEDTPDDAFTISLITGSPLSTITISPKGSNTEETSFSGHCHISASKDGKECLYFDISLKQLSDFDKPYIPQIPENLNYALIPLVGPDRVKVDHNNKTIEIDGFDPDCFNSFIDIPFQIYVKDGVDYNSIKVSSTLSWPLEGCVSKDELKYKYYYCPNSFESTRPQVYEAASRSDKYLTFVDISVQKDETIFVSVGAMAPDDPAIIRNVTLNLNGNSGDNIISYDLIIKPRDIIIDDVILNDEENNQSWLIFDRNVQENNAIYGKRNTENGLKWQAYNFVNATPALNIPFKYSDVKTQFTETKHSLYKGHSIQFSSRSSVNSFVNSWLSKYKYSDVTFVRTSPFYEENNINDWKILDTDVLELCMSKMRVSKMRMYLVSDVLAKEGKHEISICCYWPFLAYGKSIGDTSTSTTGYYVVGSDGYPSSIAIIYCDKTDLKKFIPNTYSSSGYFGFMRLVRKLTDDELTVYKRDFLGYGSNGCLLTPCLPDTYSSPGWLPN